MKRTLLRLNDLMILIIEQDENISQIIDLINAKADEFVLKPQREGGGNNVYKDDIR